MSPDGNRFGIGGNQPPEPSVIERALELIPVCDDWTTRGEITSDDDARMLGEFLEQLRTSHKKLKAGALPDRQPHLDAIAEIMARVKPELLPHEQALEALGGQIVTLLQKIELAIERIAGKKGKSVGLLAAYLAKKQQALDEEAAAKRAAAEAAQRAAQRAEDRAAVSGTIDDAVEAERAVEAATAASREARRRQPRAHVKGDLAAKAVALHDYWSARIDDWIKARKHYRQSERVVKAYDDAVQAEANAEAARLKDTRLAPDGVTFIKEQRAQ